MTLRWRGLRGDDLESLMPIALAAFPAHPEEAARFAERLLLSPSWCFALEDQAQAIKGYLVAYPWPLYGIPPLNTPLGTLPQQHQAIFLHDLALHPDAKGRGQAKAIVERLAQQAHAAGFEFIALVAVNDTAGFWRRNGFRTVEGDAALQRKLASYGEEASYMVQSLRAEPA